MTFFSAYHSPSTVKRNASEFVMGTVRLSSTPDTRRSSQSVIDGGMTTRYQGGAGPTSATPNEAPPTTIHDNTYQPGR